ncbi:hypothetical protein ATKI12_6931 [Kitasatospora sp. Ki12]
MAVRSMPGAADAPPDTPTTGETTAPPSARRALRPPSKRASPTLIRTCRAEYRAAQAEEARQPTSLFKYAPLDWEDAFGGPCDAA